MSKELSKGIKLHDRYQIEQKLGEGGFAVTYLAADLELDQFVVLKEYFPYTLSERDENGNVRPVPGEKAVWFYQGKERFLKEAKIQASLFDIPGVVKVLGYFEEHDTVYEVMEWINGITLRKYLENNGEIPDFHKAYQMLSPVFDAAAMIHQKGYLHRDISPDNIMVQEDGKLKLLDFGTARSYLADLDQAKTMTVYIKDGFTPPEQYDPHGRQGPWTDVYSLSAVLYYLMTGYTPDNARQRQLQDTLFAPSEFGCVIDAETEGKLLRRALAVDGEERYRSVSEMREDLFSSTPPAEPKEPAGRVIIPVGITAAVLCCLVLLAGFMWKKSTDLPESVIAGNYDRGSGKYEAFLAFVKDHAADVTETDDGVKYTLTKEAVMDWGEPCNQPLLPCRWEDVMEKLESEESMEFRFLGEEDILTVTDEGYGSLDTRFLNQKQYVLQNGMQILVSDDIITGNVHSVRLSQMSGDIEEIYAPAGSLAAGIFGIGETYAEEIVTGLRNGYRTNADGIKDGSAVSWCDVENDDQVIAWRYDEECGYSLVYHLMK